MYNRGKIITDDERKIIYEWAMNLRPKMDFLSNNRATASAKYIKERIPNPERIYGKGYGESKLKVNCPCEGTVKSTCPETEHQKNRRTEFIIMKM